MDMEAGAFKGEDKQVTTGLAIGAWAFPRAEPLLDTLPRCKLMKDVNNN